VPADIADAIAGLNPLSPQPLDRRLKIGFLAAADRDASAMTAQDSSDLQAKAGSAAVTNATFPCRRSARNGLSRVESSNPVTASTEHTAIHVGKQVDVRDLRFRHADSWRRNNGHSAIDEAASNALRIRLATPDGTELGRAQQKGGAAVLFGFKNGGRSDYTLSSAAGDELQIAVAGTTTVTRQNTPIGKIVRPTVRHGSKPAAAPSWQPYNRTPDSRRSRLASSDTVPAGDELGVLTLITVHTGWRDIDSRPCNCYSTTTSTPRKHHRRVRSCNSARQSLPSWGRIGRGVR